MSWITLDEYFWMKPVENNASKAFCIICKREISLSNMGKTALNSHMTGKRHIESLNVFHSTRPIFQHLGLSNVQNLATSNFESKDANPATSKAVPNIVVDENENYCSKTCRVHCSSLENINKVVNNKRTLSINRFFSTNDVTKMEIHWCIHWVMHHGSVRDLDSLIAFMKTQFPDQEVLQKVQLEKSRASYAITHGLGPWFQEKLLLELKKCDFIVLGFDECLIKISKMQQMDLVVRYWSKTENEVHTRYLNSAFLSHTRAIDLLNGIKENVPSDLLNKVNQVFMDGPNVN